MAAEKTQLVIVPNVGLAIEGSRAFLDVKAVEGLRRYAELWPGPVLCVGRSVAAGSFGYGAWYEQGDLPFAVAAVSPQATAAEIAGHCRDAALIVGGADSHLDFDFVRTFAPTPVVMLIEYTLRTRLDMLRFERRSWLQKLKTAFWLLRKERPRRRVMAEAAAIQANGAPAFEAYRRAGRDDLLYFDTRLTAAMAIDAAGADAKALALQSDKPLRLAFSGRLEPIKGADQLVPVLAAAHRHGARGAILDVYGDGSLRGEIAAQAAAAGLGAAVRVHGPIDFATELVTVLKDEIDLFLCCHPQGDPSCTYLETLGCGVPIAGYRNEAFDGVLSLGDCGVGVSVGDADGLGKAIADLDRRRDRLATLARGAAAVAEGRLFEDEFAARVAHLRRVAKV